METAAFLTEQNLLWVKIGRRHEIGLVRMKIVEDRVMADPPVNPSGKPQG